MPVIGPGTSRVFNDAPSGAEREPLEQVVATLAKMGGKIVDTSPMYGQAETVSGEIAAKLKLHAKLFLATKVWTTGKAEGIQQMERSLDLLGKKPLDLIQVHNLVNWETQLATLQEWKKEGRIRYTGITHSTTSQQAEVARVLEKEQDGLRADQFSPHGTRSRGARAPGGERARGSRHRESPLRPRRFVRSGAWETITRMGGGDRLQVVGAILSQVDRGPSGGDLCHPGHQQAASHGR